MVPDGVRSYGSKRNSPTRRCSEPGPAGSACDKPNVSDGWLRSLTSAFDNMKRYQHEISAINSAIASFNSYMAAEFRVPEFDADAAVLQKHMVEILHGRWDDFPFPNNGTRGVYFIFGHEKVLTEKNGLYIGKASFGSTTSNRLYAWLHPHRSKEQFIMNYG